MSRTPTEAQIVDSGFDTAVLIDYDDILIDILLDTVDVPIPGTGIIGLQYDNLTRTTATVVDASQTASVVDSGHGEIIISSVKNLVEVL